MDSVNTKAVLEMADLIALNCYEGALERRAAIMLRSLAAERDALRVDAERYRWLRAMAQLGSADEPEHGPCIKMLFPRVPKNLNGYIWDAPTSMKLDAAIDRAR